MLNNLFNRLKERSKLTKKLARTLSICLSICFALQANVQRCQAQYFGLGNGIGYYGLGSSLLYPLSYLFYGGGYSSSYAPFYALGTLGSLGSYALYNSYRSMPYNYSGNSFPYNNNYGYWANNYSAGATPNTNPSPYNPNYPFNNNNSNPNQNQTSGWNYTPNQTSFTPQQSIDPNAIFSSKYAPTSTYTDFPVNSGTPPTAPDRRTLGQAQTPNSTFSGSVIPDTRALEGFFQTVNTRYKGNLVHALNQADMNSWAESLGLITPGQQLSKTISQTRKSQISNIVKDPSIESQKKFDILRLLLQ